MRTFHPLSGVLSLRIVLSLGYIVRRCDAALPSIRFVLSSPSFRFPRKKTISTALSFSIAAPDQLLSPVFSFPVPLLFAFNFFPFSISQLPLPRYRRYDNLCWRKWHYRARFVCFPPHPVFLQSVPTSPSPLPNQRLKKRPARASLHSPDSLPIEVLLKNRALALNDLSACSP